MKLLLDTHIWLWSRRDARLIGKRVWSELENEANELWLSPISTWEALILHRKGKIVLHADPIHWVKQMTLGFREAPLTHEIVVTAEGLHLSHADPADRFLAYCKSAGTHLGYSRPETTRPRGHRHVGKSLKWPKK